MKRLFQIFALLVALLWVSPSFSATYYVSATGNDSNTGLSHAQAWLTIDKVRGFTFAAGDDVYFRCGDTFTPSATLYPWAGASAVNRTIIGAYYMVGETETIGVSGTRPIIDGQTYTVPLNFFSEYTASSTSLAIGTGGKSLTVATGQTWLTVGKSITIRRVYAGSSNTGYYYWMKGTVYSYNVGTGALIVTVTSCSSTPYIGTWNDWQVGRTDSWLGMIQFSGSGKDYITIENLIIQKSGSIGIKIYGDRTAAGSPKYWVIDNVYVAGSWLTGISLLYLSYTDGVVEDCEVTNYSMDFGSDKPTNVYGSLGNWSGGIAVMHSPYSDITIKRNSVHHGWGEAIIIGSTPTASNLHHGHVVVEDNTVFCSRRVDVYACNSEEVTIRNNLLLGGGDAEIQDIASFPPATRLFHSTSADGRYWNQTGVYIAEERVGQTVVNANANSTFSKDIFVYNNVIAGHYSGISMGSQIIGTVGTPDRRVWENVRIHNNTFISNWINVSLSYYDLADYTLTNCEIKNNISWCPAGDKKSVEATSTTFWSNFTADYNSWTGAVHADLAGTHDVVTNVAFEKITGWQSLTDIVGDDDFKVTSNNNGVNTGVSLAAYFTTDHFGSDRPVGAAWDMGAYEYDEPGPEDAANPVCTIATNGGSNFSTDTASIELTGTASDDVSVASVTWACATCTPASGTATGTITWSFTASTLTLGANEITVTATDPSSKTGADTITVTRVAAPVFSGTITGLVGTGGTGAVSKGTSGYIGW